MVDFTSRQSGKSYPVTWALALILVIPLAAGAQDAGSSGSSANQPPSLPVLQQKVQKAFGAEDYGKALEYLGRMARQLPFDGKLMYETAAAYALKGDPERAFDMLVTIQRQGLSHSPRGDERFDSLSEYQLFDHISELLEKNGEPFEQAHPALSVDAGLKWPQALARRGADGDFFLAGLGQGRIVRVAAGGQPETFFEPGEGGPQGISALAVDDERGVLWAAGTAVRDGDGGLSINMKAAALYRIDLESGELKDRYPIGDAKGLPHLFNEIALGPEGSVYAANALSPMIYRYEEGAETLEAFAGAGGLTGFHGIDVTPDGRYVLVSDWFTGLYRVGVSDRQAHRLAPGEFVNLGGIHSLSYREGELLAVQTGTTPDRVMRIELSDDLGRAESMFPLSASQAEYDKPGLGILAGDAYYFVADSRWSLREGPGANGTKVTVLKADPELGRDVKRPAIPAKPSSGIQGHEKPDGVVVPPGSSAGGTGETADSDDDPEQ